MIFENEVNLFDPNAIVNEFHAQTTQINVVQGKISAMISDSQIQELQNGTVNMFDRLVSAEADITGIRTQVSSLRQKDGELESQISTISQTASAISLEVSAVKNNYAQKAQIILAINNTTQQSETVINAEHISLAGKTINLTSDNIAITSTNFKVTKAGALTATSATISGTITSSSGTIGGFTLGSTNLHNGMTSLADTTHDGVWVGTDGIALGKGNFKVTKAGALTAKNATITGTITASSGTIGGFTIGSNNIHNGMTSLTDTTNNGVWLGTNGIALGKGAFKVTSAGALSASNVSITGGTIRTTDGTRISILESGYTKYYYGPSNTYIGYIGAVTANSEQGLMFNLKTDGDYMGWFLNGEADPVLIYDKSSWLTKDIWEETINAVRDVHIADGYVLASSRIADPSWQFDGRNYAGYYGNVTIDNVKFTFINGVCTAVVNI